MKKLFFRVLPYLIFTLVAIFILVGVTAGVFASEIIVCVLADVAPTSGLIWLAVITGFAAMILFIVEES